MLPLESHPLDPLSPSTLASTHAPLSLVGVTDLAAVLIQCFALIFIGYLSGRFQLISESESKGLSTFVGCFSLPALIFQSLATSDLSTISWSFVASVFLAKVLLFIMVAAITLTVTSPTNNGLAGLYGIFCTQSNDFALGYPLLASLYHDTHPEFARYLYVLAPIQLVVINPVGLFLMEIQKQSEPSSRHQKGWVIFVKVMKGIAQNPIIIMTVLGLAWNLILGPKMPDLVAPFFKVLSGAFSAAALFLLGLNMVGRLSLFRQSSVILLPLVLVMTKIILLPLMIKAIVQYVTMDSVSKEAIDMNNFGFLYGTLPAAPTVFIFALQYEMPSTVVASGMVLSTILSAPLMFISANMIRQSDGTSSSVYQEDLVATMSYSGLLSIIGLSWVLIVMIVGRKWTSITHRCTLALALSQLAIGIGGYFWTYFDMDHYDAASRDSFWYRLQYVLMSGGTLSTRIWTAVLAMTIAALHWKSLCFAIRVQKSLFIGAACLIICLGSFMIFDPSYLSPGNRDPNFYFGTVQPYVGVVISVVSLFITTIALLAQQYFKSKLAYYQSLSVNEDIEDIQITEEAEVVPHEVMPHTERRRTVSGSRTTEAMAIEVEDIIAHETCPTSSSCSNEQRKRCNANIRRYYENIQNPNETAPLVIMPVASSESDGCHQLVHHFILLLALVTSTLISLTMAISKLVLEKPSGIFIELEFLDILLNYGQGVVTFLIFGFDAQLVISRISEFLSNRNAVFSYQFRLPDSDELQPVTRQICQQFVCFHKENCSTEILTMYKRRGGQNVRAFRGDQLVSWIVGADLAPDRKHAETYARHLLLGRVIEHVDSCQHFHDGPFLYRFGEIDRHSS